MKLTVTKMANKKRPIAFLRTTQIAKEDVYRTVPPKHKDDKPEEELVCYRGEPNPETDAYTGPWYEDELIKWIDHAVDMNGTANTQWKVVYENDLPDGFKDTNIL